MDNNNKMAEHMMKSNYTCDVLIIGGGSAGLRAALEAHDAGANVLRRPSYNTCKRRYQCSSWHYGSRG
jgi:aspartate oxidase